MRFFFALILTGYKTPAFVNTLKIELYQYLLSAIQDKITALENNLAAIKESISNETKSTAGDKYETARAMLHIEQGNMMQQLSNAFHQKNELNVIDIDNQSPVSKHGSLIFTSNGIFFIAIAYGSVQIANKTIIVLSAQSPLGKLFIGKRNQETVVFNNNNFLINEII